MRSCTPPGSPIGGAEGRPIFAPPYRNAAAVFEEGAASRPTLWPEGAFSQRSPGHPYGFPASVLARHGVGRAAAVMVIGAVADLPPLAAARRDRARNARVAAGGVSRRPPPRALAARSAAWSPVARALGRT